MEKSFATDPAGVRRVIKAGEEAEKKNLKIAAGLMCRHSANRQELIKRIRDGELGQIQLIRAYRMEAMRAHGARSRPTENELLLADPQLRTTFLWVSGGLCAEMDIHQIDEICWLKDAWPVSAHGIGGRAANSTDRSQNLDSFSIEWTFADGTKAYDVVRYIPNCYNEFATFVHGTKCAAQFSGTSSRHVPHLQGPACTRSRSPQVRSATGSTVFQEPRKRDNIVWQAPKEKYTSWQAEWNVLLDSIRNDRPQNEAKRAAYSNLTDMMGRAAVHMGQIITWDEMLNSNFQFCPNIDTHDREQPAAGPARRQRPLPGARSPASGSRSELADGKRDGDNRH